MEENEKYKPKTIPLEKIPEDVYRMIIKLQSIEKDKCGCQKSIPTTVYSLIRRAYNELHPTN